MEYHLNITSRRATCDTAPSDDLPLLMSAGLTPTSLWAGKSKGKKIREREALLLPPGGWMDAQKVRNGKRACTNSRIKYEEEESESKVGK